MTVVLIQMEKPRRHVASGVMLEIIVCRAVTDSGEAPKSSEPMKCGCFEYNITSPLLMSYLILTILDHLSSSQVAEGALSI